jgi:cytochrome b6-f complex iron-sulfur subunit
MNAQHIGGEPGRAGELDRRQFLNYAWLASLGVLFVQGALVTYQFAKPRVREGEFGSEVSIDAVDSLPGEGEQPLAFDKAKFWWVESEAGALALYKVCTHLGCIYDWKASEGKFICPCHGSQFMQMGKRLTGPAPRDLDRFVIRAYDQEGNLVAETNEAGDPLQIPAGATVVVDTGERIRGAPA